METKRSFSTDERQDAASEGHALPDGSYPVKNESDLRNAIQAFGRAKDKDAARRHIMKRARALGRTDLIPESWTSEKGYGEEMKIDEKAAVAVDADGAVTECPEGDVAACEYKNGDKVCGKCGAMASAAPEEAMEETEKKGEMCACESPTVDDKGMCEKCGMPVKIEKKDNEEQSEVLEEKTGEEEVVTEARGEEEESPMALDEKQLEILTLRDEHMKSLTGDIEVKSADGTDGGFLCSLERKVLPLDSAPCEGCSGGCHVEKGYPDLLMVEAIAKKTLGGEVLDSGYSGLTDLYLVDISRKDDQGEDEIIQAVYSGAGKLKG